MRAQKHTSRCFGFGLLLAIFLASLSNPGALVHAKDKSENRPRQILIIRHAEKPLADSESVHLSHEGKERADELYHLFKTSADRPDPFPTPDFIFAAQNSKHSHRSVETVTPLAKKLKLRINFDYRDEDFARLAQEILLNPKYAGKTILICWHHGLAPNLANRLGAADAPSHWSGSVFDRVWQINYEKDGEVAFKNLPQQLPSKVLVK